MQKSSIFFNKIFYSFKFIASFFSYWSIFSEFLWPYINFCSNGVFNYKRIIPVLVQWILWGNIWYLEHVGTIDQKRLLHEMEYMQDWGWQIWCNIPHVELQISPHNQMLIATSYWGQVYYADKLLVSFIAQ